MAYTSPRAWLAAILPNTKGSSQIARKKSTDWTCDREADERAASHASARERGKGMKAGFEASDEEPIARRPSQADQKVAGRRGLQDCCIIWSTQANNYVRSLRWLVGLQLLQHSTKDAGTNLGAAPAAAHLGGCQHRQAGRIQNKAVRRLGGWLPGQHLVKIQVIPILSHECPVDSILPGPDPPALEACVRGNAAGQARWTSQHFARRCAPRAAYPTSP